jgi:hypothetical protein
MTVYVLAATMEDAKAFCISRRITKNAKWVSKKEDWPTDTLLLDQDMVVPLNSFFTLPDWQEVLDGCPVPLE